MNRFLSRLTPFVIVLAAMSSCEFDEPDFSNVTNFKLVEMEGQHIEGEFDVDCENPNGFGFKMKKANIDVIVDDQVLGKITLDHKIKVKRKSKKTYTVPLSIDLENGAMFKMIQLSMRKEITVLLKGKVRGSVCGISKSFAVNETKKIEGSLLKMGSAEE